MVDGSWAFNNVARQENFGHRAAHLTALTAKAIIERYCARAPEYSYFVGCSRGGGQAMMETQRYPEDVFVASGLVQWVSPNRDGARWRALELVVRSRFQ
jgi:hypothetical protein